MGLTMNIILISDCSTFCTMDNKYIKSWYICTHFSWFFVCRINHIHTHVCQIVIALWKKYCLGSDLCAGCLLKNNFPNVATQCAPITNYKQIVSFLVHFYIWPQTLKTEKYIYFFPLKYAGKEGRPLAK